MTNLQVTVAMLYRFFTCLTACYRCLTLLRLGYIWDFSELPKSRLPCGFLKGNVKSFTLAVKCFKLWLIRSLDYWGILLCTTALSVVSKGVTIVPDRLTPRHLVWQIVDQPLSSEKDMQQVAARLIWTVLNAAGCSWRNFGSRAVKNREWWDETLRSSRRDAFCHIQLR